MGELSMEDLEKQLKDGWIKDQPYVFVSYASKNKDKVFEAVLELRKRGINVYVDVELQENISKNWIENIKERLLDCDCKGMVSFISIDFMRSYACLIEQLMPASDDMIEEKGKKLPNFYISLDERMGTPQGIHSVIYESEIKQSQEMKVTMVPEERTVLQTVMENNAEIRTEIKESGKTVSGELDKIKTKHHIVVNMYKYFFAEKSVSLQLYKTAKECAGLLYNNFVNEKNDSIHMEVLPELVQRYGEMAVQTESRVVLEQSESENQTVEQKEDDAAEKPETSDGMDGLLYYNGAVGKDNGLGGIILQKGSKISRNEVASCPENAKKKRKEAADKGWIVDEGDFWRLTEEMEFKSRSGAACFVSGSSVNGMLAWKEGQVSDSHIHRGSSSGDEVSSKISQICMVVASLKKDPKPIENYSKALQVVYGNVAADLNIVKSSVVDKCQRQLNLSAMEFAKYMKEYMEAESDELYKIVLNAAKNQAEKDLINRTFAR